MQEPVHLNLSSVAVASHKGCCRKMVTHFVASRSLTKNCNGNPMLPPIIRLQQYADMSLQPICCRGGGSKEVDENIAYKARRYGKSSSDACCTECENTVSRVSIPYVRFRSVTQDKSDAGFDAGKSPACAGHIPVHIL